MIDRWAIAVWSEGSLGIEIADSNRIREWWEDNWEFFGPPQSESDSIDQYVGEPGMPTEGWRWIGDGDREDEFFFFAISPIER